MAKFVGTWTVGDEGRILRYSFENADGTAFDLTGATLIKLRARSYGDKGATIERTGVIFGAATNGEADFDDLTNGASLGNEEQLTYEAEIQFTKSSKVYFMERFDYQIRKAI